MEFDMSNRSTNCLQRAWRYLHVVFMTSSDCNATDNIKSNDNKFNIIDIYFKLA